MYTDKVFFNDIVKWMKTIMNQLSIAVSSKTSDIMDRILKLNTKLVNNTTQSKEEPLLLPQKR